MPQLVEKGKRLSIKQTEIESLQTFNNCVLGFNDVFVIVLPQAKNEEYYSPIANIGELTKKVSDGLGAKSTLIVLGEVIDLVEVAKTLGNILTYQSWIAIKTRTIRYINHSNSLPSNHIGALVYTKYSGSLKHAKTRIPYTFCPACDKTTKDYGGKKHTYHEYGTLISDVWRDVTADLDDSLEEIFERFADLFGIDQYKELYICDCRKISFSRKSLERRFYDHQEMQLESDYINRIIEDDCLEGLSRIPDNSIDFAFADPPYNLKKVYSGYADNLEIEEYFKWCDNWLKELARVLKPGRTLALLNIPIWSVRHFLFLTQELQFQNWITWDALSYPVRLIMPAHYTILCFSKGESRELPGLSRSSDVHLLPQADNYCLREKCIRERTQKGINDRGELTDLWSDIHRLKHNIRRVDHPCQLPPNLMYRLIALFTEPNEIVLDPFNGAGTTTLTAHQTARHYIGIELTHKYVEMANSRHEEILKGLNPFRKEERKLTSKNSPVPRLPKRKYAIPKKTLQLEVKRVAELLGHIPNRDELIEHGKYSIQYYDEYFMSWGEVTAAARTTGMSETRKNGNSKNSITRQFELFEIDNKKEK